MNMYWCRESENQWSEDKCDGSERNMSSWDWWDWGWSGARVHGSTSSCT